MRLWVGKIVRLKCIARKCECDRTGKYIPGKIRAITKLDIFLCNNVFSLNEVSILSYNLYKLTQ